MTSLQKRIKAEIAEDPSRIPEVIDAIKEGLSDFIEGEKTKRTGLAATAMRSLLMFANTKGKPIPYLIDIAFHQFPTGPGPHSPVEMEFWQGFVQQASGYELDRRWLIETRGWDCLYWWDTYVIPAPQPNAENTVQDPSQ